MSAPSRESGNSEALVAAVPVLEGDYLDPETAPLSDRFLRGEIDLATYIHTQLGRNYRRKLDEEFFVQRPWEYDNA